MVPAVSTGISPVPAYSGYPPCIYPVPYGTLTPCGRPSHAVQVKVYAVARVLQPRMCRNTRGLGCSASARRYSRNHSCFLLLRVLRCFSSPRSPPEPNRDSRHAPGGLPHSEICGSNRMCRSPQLIAACHVLLRLWEPRHPPCALVHLFRRAHPFARARRRTAIWPARCIFCSTCQRTNNWNKPANVIK
jgi:hypothetical protein